MAQKTGDTWANTMRWSGRVLALLAVGLFLLFLFQSGARVFPTLTWNKPQGWPMMVAMVVALVGMVAAWRWEAGGGVVALAGAIAIVVLVVLGSGLDMLVPAIMFVAPLALAGLLYLGCSARCRGMVHREKG